MVAPFINDPDLTIHVGDVRDVLPTLEDESVDCVATSPPFYGLRDYGVDRQIGLEATPDEWAAELVAVFRECRRILRRHGTLWVECGDSYAGAGPQRRNEGETDCGNRGDHAAIGTVPVPRGSKPKDLIGAPWKLAQALQAPYYTGAIKAERDRVWLAATIDAEGSICGHRHTRKDDGSMRTGIHITITNTVVAMLDEAERIWPASRQQHDNRESSIGSRPCWRWVATNVDHNGQLMRELYPYLIAKRKQALLAFNFYEMSSISKRFGKVPQGAAMREKRDWIVGALSDLNNGREIDLPSWIAEPPGMYEQGWYLRQCIVWHKPNAMPESVRDRCTTAHSYVFLFSKQPRYWFDADAIAEEFSLNTNSRGKPHSTPKEHEPGRGVRSNSSFAAATWGNTAPHLLRKPQVETLDGSDGERPRGPDGRLVTHVEGRDGSAQHRNGERWPGVGKNARSVWTIPTRGYSGAHFATWPETLAERIIKAGCPEWVCGTCGKPRERLVDVEPGALNRIRDVGGRVDGYTRPRRPPDATDADMATKRRTVGWSDCGHGNYRPCTILDPFLGAGTTGIVARRLGRRCVGVELNEEYARLAAERCQQLSLLAEEGAA